MVQKRNNISSKSMTYCLNCKKHTNIMASRCVTMTNKVLIQNSKCSAGFFDKSRFLKQRPNKKTGLNTLKLFIKHAGLLLLLS